MRRLHCTYIQRRNAESRRQLSSILQVFRFGAMWITFVTADDYSFLASMFLAGKIEP
jgi:hypothetical protein